MKFATGGNKPVRVIEPDLNLFTMRLPLVVVGFHQQLLILLAVWNFTVFAQPVMRCRHERIQFQEVNEPKPFVPAQLKLKLILINTEKSHFVSRSKVACRLYFWSWCT